MSIERPLASSAKIHDAAASRTAEHVRLEEARGGRKWRRWGTYVSERQWGTVREDYSRDGDAWGYFTHEMAQ